MQVKRCRTSIMKVAAQSGMVCYDENYFPFGIRYEFPSVLWYCWLNVLHPVDFIFF